MKKNPVQPIFRLIPNTLNPILKRSCSSYFLVHFQTENRIPKTNFLFLGWNDNNAGANKHQDIIKKVIDPWVVVVFSLHNKQEKFSPPGDKIPSVTLIVSAVSRVGYEKNFTISSLDSNKELLDKCERGNKIAPLWRKCWSKQSTDAEGVQIYCPSSTYPAIVL